MPTNPRLLWSLALIPTGISDPSFSPSLLVGRSTRPKTFNPKYDLVELSDSFSLHGELPGVQQEDIDIEFTNPQTMTIRGRSECSYTSGTQPVGLIEGSMTSGAITESGKASKTHETVIKEEHATNKETCATLAQPPQAQGPQEKYWLCERAIGEFSRSFIFHVRVDQDHVQASMKNGLLTIVIPKAQKDESRKITVS